MAVTTLLHPFTYLSPEEAENPLQALRNCVEDRELFDDRKHLLAAMTQHLANQEEETDDLSKEDQIDLSHRLVKMLEAAYAFSQERPTRTTNGTIANRPLGLPDITLRKDWTNAPAFLDKGNREDPIAALIDTCNDETLFERRIAADKIFHQMVQSEKWQLDDPDDNKKDLQYVADTRAVWELGYLIVSMIQSGRLSFQYAITPV